MKKIKLWVETGFVGATHEEIIEVDDDTTEEEIDEIALEFLHNCIEYGWSNEVEENAD